jgi:hypothetical protein|tara:strand:+ start:375 stop:803 length:429 start_codon:yes stop_codon:yes gene_type:complete
MSASSRRKGHQFERDICHKLQDDLGDIFQHPIRRDLDQTREGSLGDIHLDPFVIECKRYACKFEPPSSWWEQVWRAGQHMDRIPVLVWKVDRRPIKVMLPLYAISQDFEREKNLTATTDWDTAMLIIREEMSRQYLERIKDE